MTVPVRIQLSRKKGFDLQLLSLKTNGLPAVVVTRHSEWGNPFAVNKSNYIATTAHPNPKTEWWVENSTNAWRFATKDEATEAAVKLFRVYAESEKNSTWRQRARLALKGRNLACYCKCSPCHADVLLEIAAAETT